MLVRIRILCLTDLIASESSTAGSEQLLRAGTQHQKLMFALFLDLLEM